MMNIADHYHVPSGMAGSPYSQPHSIHLLNAAVDEAQRNIMAPRELIFMTALTSIALVSQGLIDVRKPNDQVVPTSLMLLTIADSGERKTTVEGVFLKPVRDFQHQQTVNYQSQVETWETRHAIWAGSEKDILKASRKMAGKDQSIFDAEQDLSKHRKLKPLKPRKFKLLYEDATSEALFLGLHENLPTAGLTSSDGGGVLDGRALNDLSKMNTIWSGGPITVDRKTVECFTLSEARLTVSIMAQESAVSDYMARRGDRSRGSGLWARFLIAHPESTQGYRTSGAAPSPQVYCEQFAARLTELLHLNVVLLEEPTQKKNVIEFSAEAKVRWYYIANDIEMAIRPGGDFEAASDHASKLADNIARVAALFHYFEKLEGDIALSTLEAAIQFCGFRSDDFLKLFVPPPQEQQDAEVLDNWLNSYRHRGKHIIRKNQILQYGPSKLRKRDRLDGALEVLWRRGSILIGEMEGAICVDVMPGIQLHQPMPNMQMSSPSIFNRI